MLNISIEQIVKVNPPAYAKPLKIALVILTIFCVLLAFTSVGILLLVAMIVITVFVFKYFNYEYEYTLVDDTLDIDRITAKTMRKHCETFNMSKLDIMAPLGSEKLEYKEHSNCKTYDFSSKGRMDATVYVAFINYNNTLVRVLLEPTENMLDAFLKIAPRKVFVEEQYK